MTPSKVHASMTYIKAGALRAVCAAVVMKLL